MNFYSAKVASGSSSLHSVGPTSNKHAIADRLEDLAVELRGLADEESHTAPSQEALVKLAKIIYNGRRKVDELFAIPGLAVSPGWDIMLDLFIAKSGGRTISVSSACIGAACPSTTALRWIGVLEKTGLIYRHDDPHDKRRSVLELSPDAVAKIEQALRKHE